MMAGLIASWLFLPIRPTFVFPLAAIAVGTHYAAFRTAYGDLLFWILGGLVSLAGVLALYGIPHSAVASIFSVGAIELAFAAVLTSRNLRDTNS